MSRLIYRPRVLLIACVVLAGLFVTENVVLAAVHYLRTGGAVKSVAVATNDQQDFFPSTTWTNIPGTSVTMTVPSGEHDIFLISYSSDASCLDVDTCDVRVVVNGTAALPAPSELGVTSAIVTDSAQFVAGPDGPGSYTITAQAKVTFPGTNPTFEVLWPTMTVERAKSS